MQHDARAEEGVLFQLKTRGPQTAAQVGRRLGVTAMAVRQHLYRLKVEGLVEFSDERRKVGRPARVWRLTSAAAEPLAIDPWSLSPGIAIPPYERPSKYENNVVRTLTNPNNEARGSAARTPHHLLNGTITPNGLHFVVARGGFPEASPIPFREAMASGKTCLSCISLGSHLATVLTEP